MADEKGLRVPFGFDLDKTTVADMKKHSKMVGKQASNEMTKEFDKAGKKVEKTLSQAVRSDSAFKKRMSQLESALKKELQKVGKNEEAKKRVVRKYYKALDRMGVRHVSRQGQLAQKAAQIQENIIDKSLNKQKKSFKEYYQDIKMDAKGGGGINLGNVVGGIKSIHPAAIVATAAIAGIGKGISKLNQLADAFKPINRNLTILRTNLGSISDIDFSRVRSQLQGLTTQLAVNIETISGVAAQLDKSIPADRISQMTELAIKAAQEGERRLDVTADDVRDYSKQVQRLLAGTNNDFENLETNLAFFAKTAGGSMIPLIDALTEVPTVLSKAKIVIKDSNEAVKASALAFEVASRSSTEFTEVTTQVEELFLRFSTDPDKIKAFSQKYNLNLNTNMKTSEDFIDVMATLAENAERFTGIDLDEAFGGTASEGLNAFLEMGEDFRKMAHEFIKPEDFGSIADALKTSMEGMDQQISVRIDNINKRIGESWATAQHGINEQIIYMFSTTEEHFQHVAKKVENLQLQFKAVSAAGSNLQPVFERFAEIDLSNLDPTDVQGAIELLTDNMDELGMISGISRQRIQDVLANDSMTSEERVRALQKELVQANKVMQLMSGKSLKDIESELRNLADTGLGDLGAGLEIMASNFEDFLTDSQEEILSYGTGGFENMYTNMSAGLEQIELKLQTLTEAGERIAEGGIRAQEAGDEKAVAEFAHQLDLIDNIYARLTEKQGNLQAQQNTFFEQTELAIQQRESLLGREMDAEEKLAYFRKNMLADVNDQTLTLGGNRIESSKALYAAEFRLRMLIDENFAEQQKALGDQATERETYQAVLDDIAQTESTITDLMQDENASDVLRMTNKMVLFQLDKQREEIGNRLNALGTEGVEIADEETLAAQIQNDALRDQLESMEDFTQRMTDIVDKSGDERVAMKRNQWQNQLAEIQDFHDEEMDKIKQALEAQLITEEQYNSRVETLDQASNARRLSIQDKYNKDQADKQKSFQQQIEDAYIDLQYGGTTKGTLMQEDVRFQRQAEEMRLAGDAQETIALAEQLHQAKIAKIRKDEHAKQQDEQKAHLDKMQQDAQKRSDEAAARERERLQKEIEQRKIQQEELARIEMEFFNYVQKQKEDMRNSLLDGFQKTFFDLSAKLAEGLEKSMGDPKKVKKAFETYYAQFTMQMVNAISDISQDALSTMEKYLSIFKDDSIRSRFNELRKQFAGLDAQAAKMSRGVSENISSAMSRFNDQIVAQRKLLEETPRYLERIADTEQTISKIGGDLKEVIVDTREELNALQESHRNQTIAIAQVEEKSGQFRVTYRGLIQEVNKGVRIVQESNPEWEKQDRVLRRMEKSYRIFAASADRAQGALNALGEQGREFVDTFLDVSETISMVGLAGDIIKQAGDQMEKLNDGGREAVTIFKALTQQQRELVGYLEAFDIDIFTGEGLTSLIERVDKDLETLGENADQFGDKIDQIARVLKMAGYDVENLSAKTVDEILIMWDEAKAKLPGIVAEFGDIESKMASAFSSKSIEEWSKKLAETQAKMKAEATGDRFFDLTTTFIADTAKIEESKQAILDVLEITTDPADRKVLYDKLAAWNEILRVNKEIYDINVTQQLRDLTQSVNEALRPMRAALDSIKQTYDDLEKDEMSRYKKSLEVIKDKYDRYEIDQEMYLRQTVEAEEEHSENLRKILFKRGIDQAEAVSSQLQEYMSMVETVQNGIFSIIDAFSGADKSAAGMISGITQGISTITGLIPGIGGAISQAIGMVGGLISGIVQRVQAKREEERLKLLEKQKKIQEDLLKIMKKQNELIQRGKELGVEFYQDTANQLLMINNEYNKFLKQFKDNMELYKLYDKQIADMDAAESASGFIDAFTKASALLASMNPDMKLLIDLLDDMGVSLESAAPEDLLKILDSIDEMGISDSSKENLKELVQGVLDFMIQLRNLQKELFDQQKSQFEHYIKMGGDEIAINKQILSLTKEQLQATDESGNLLYVGAERNALLEQEKELQENIIDLQKEYLQNINEQREAIRELADIFDSDLSAAYEQLKTAMTGLNKAVSLGDLEFDELNDYLQSIKDAYATIIAGGGDIDTASLNQYIADMQDKIDQLPDTIEYPVEMEIEVGKTSTGEPIYETISAIRIEGNRSKIAMQQLIDTMGDMLGPLTKRATIEKQMAILQHDYNMETITEEEFIKRKIKLLEEMLALMIEQNVPESERFQIELEIHKLYQKQNEMLEDQTKLQDKLLDKLSRRHQLLMQSYRQDKVLTSDEQVELAALETLIEQRMRDLGYSEDEIQQAMQAYREMRGYEAGGRIDKDQVAKVHGGEAVLNAPAVSYLDKMHPGLIDALNNSKRNQQSLQAEMDRFNATGETPTMRRQMQEFSKAMAVYRHSQAVTKYYQNQEIANHVTQNLNLEQNVNIHGNNPDVIADKVMGLVRQEFPKLMQEAEKQRGIRPQR